MIAVLLLLIMKQGAVSTVWYVTFENPNPCAVKGSSVEFRCSYNYPDEETVQQTLWSKGDLKDGNWIRDKLSVLPSYKNRTRYLGDQQHNCSLALHDLQYNDSGYYYFSFDTDRYGRRSKRSVYLSVTELRVRVNPRRVRAGDTVTLECRTSCELSSTVWLKDGRHPVTKPAFQAQEEDAGNYSCAVKGQESVQSEPVALDVWYFPLNVSVEVSPVGLLTVGSSVTLTCNSTVDLAADDYTWYREAVSSSSSLLQVGSGRVLSLPSVEVSHTGLYFCKARNRLRGNSSAKVLLTVEKADMNRFILLVGMGVKGIILLLLPVVIFCAWRRWRNSAADREKHSHVYENIRR
ncbi:B-cell receptor CD22 [Brachyistius frenatus]|uniref:B-cell receptor CD22 n=1 Tax=Brachyistius frenatus TaxID=100188 RepID=UPI0037E7C69D